MLNAFADHMHFLHFYCSIIEGKDGAGNYSKNNFSGLPRNSYDMEDNILSFYLLQLSGFSVQ